MRLVDQYRIGREDRKQREKGEGGGGGHKKEWGQRNGFLRVLGIAVLKIQIDQTAPKRVEGVVEQLNTWVAPKYSSIKALKYLYATAHTLYKRVRCSFPLSCDYFVCINGDRRFSVFVTRQFYNVNYWDCILVNDFLFRVIELHTHTLFYVTWKKIVTICFFNLSIIYR